MALVSINYTPIRVEPSDATKSPTRIATTSIASETMASSLPDPAFSPPFPVRNARSLRCLVQPNQMGPDAIDE